MPWIRLLVLACNILPLSALCATRSQVFKPPCGLPSDFEPRDIDRVCPAVGRSRKSMPNPAALELQNIAKNNFCATGPPKDLTISDFVQLQRIIEMLNIPFGNTGRLPEDRSSIQNNKKLYFTSGGGGVSEGSLVRVAGYVLSAKVSDVSTGQSSYCQMTGVDANAFVIHLVAERSQQNPCSSIAVEMNPHYRPAAWTLNALMAVQAAAVKVRATGQLFLNASHEPCVPTAAGSQHPIPIALGASIWEVLPVYSFDVCAMPGNDCNTSNDRGWVSLKTWQVNSGGSKR